jgi:hypothetical protein
MNRNVKMTMNDDIIYRVFNEIFYVPESFINNIDNYTPRDSFIEAKKPSTNSELDNDTESISEQSNDSNQATEQNTKIANDSDMTGEYIEQKILVNRMILPFLGACHIWADEAYVTFGALEFVKKEKEILGQTPDRYLNCDSLIETFFENLGMMIFHIIEEAHEKHIFNDKVRDHQSISDAFSKYLRRAMLTLDMRCYNDFGQLKRRFFTYSEKIHFIKRNSNVIKYYLKIKTVEQNNSKKAEYFKIFKKHFYSFSVKELVNLAMNFYFSFSKQLIIDYDQEAMYDHSHVYVHVHVENDVPNE